MPMHPFTSRVVIVVEQNLERTSRHLSVTPTIPNKLHHSFNDIRDTTIARDCTFEWGHKIYHMLINIVMKIT